MNNEEMNDLLDLRKDAQEAFRESLKGLSNQNPMTLIMGGGKGLGSFAAQFERVALLNDALITELAERALSHGNT